MAAQAETAHGPRVNGQQRNSIGTSIPHAWLPRPCGDDPTLWFTRECNKDTRSLRSQGWTSPAERNRQGHRAGARERNVRSARYRGVAARRRLPGNTENVLRPLRNPQEPLRRLPFPGKPSCTHNRATGRAAEHLKARRPGEARVTPRGPGSTAARCKHAARSRLMLPPHWTSAVDTARLRPTSAARLDLMSKRNQRRGGTKTPGRAQ